MCECSCACACVCVCMCVCVCVSECECECKCVCMCICKCRCKCVGGSKCACLWATISARPSNRGRSMPPPVPRPPGAAPCNTSPKNILMHRWANFALLAGSSGRTSHCPSRRSAVEPRSINAVLDTSASRCGSMQNFSQKHFIAQTDQSCSACLSVESYVALLVVS